MTACNVIITPKAGYLASDTAGYTVDYKNRVVQIETFYQKTTAFPHLRSAFTGSGHLLFLNSVANALSFSQQNARSIDAALPRLQEICVASSQHHEYQMDEVGQPMAVVFLVGWSDAENRIVGFTATNRDGADFEPARMPDTCWLQPGNGQGDVRKEFAMDWGVWPHRRFTKDPEPFMMEAMRKQRAAAIALGGEGPEWFIHVAGEIIFTEITRTGVRQRSIHQWPDKIGDALTHNQAVTAAA